MLNIPVNLDCIQHAFVCLKMLLPLQILFSYMTLERLGIIAFKAPNLAATTQIDNLNIPTSPDPSGMRKTTKKITFHDHLWMQPHCTAAPLPIPAAMA